MAKMVVAAAGVALALFYPGLSHAGRIQVGSYTGDVSFEAFVEGVSSDATNGSSVVECLTETQCQIEAPEAPGTHQPVIRFVIDVPQVIHVQALFWNDFDCPTELPDQMVEGDVDFSLVDPGSQVGIRIIFSDPPPDGFTFAMEWNIDTCPSSDCHDYTLGDPGDQCM